MNNKEDLKKTRRLASPALGRRQRRSCTYTVFLKFPTASNELLAGDLYFLKVQKRIDTVGLYLSFSFIPCSIMDAAFNSCFISFNFYNANLNTSGLM